MGSRDARVTLYIRKSLTVVGTYLFSRQFFFISPRTGLSVRHRGSGIHGYNRYTLYIYIGTTRSYLRRAPGGHRLPSGMRGGRKQLLGK